MGLRSGIIHRMLPPLCVRRAHVSYFKRAKQSHTVSSIVCESNQAYDQIAAPKVGPPARAAHPTLCTYHRPAPPPQKRSRSPAKRKEHTVLLARESNPALDGTIYE